VRRFAPTGTPLPCGGVGQWAWHLVLPWFTFALFFVALYMRIVRARMLEVLDEPYIRTARAKGASEARVIRSHAQRNAIAPVVTMTAMDAGMAIGIAMYIETVFGLPGLGRTMIRALAGFQGYDLPVILAVTLVAAAAIIVLNLVADIVLLFVDPTIVRRQERGVLRASGRTA
jgi:peptide/nickel transport system permease protein